MAVSFDEKSKIEIAKHFTGWVGFEGSAVFVIIFGIGQKMFAIQ